jgi:hypothetical protein
MSKLASGNQEKRPKAIFPTFGNVGANVVFYEKRFSIEKSDRIAVPY